VSLKLIIAGLRRSGTTIFWQTFRQDRRLLCYDEPFQPHLCVLPESTGLKAPEEYQRLLEREPREFWDRYTPIHFSDELRAELSERQVAWLEYIASSGEQVVIDVTRCHFKIAALHRLAPEATLVHLFRPPASHASSHMLPSASGLRGRVRKLLCRRGFWSRRGGYDGWHFESIIGNSTVSPFARLLPGAGLDPEQVYRLPAVGRLLAYWRVAYEHAEREGRRCFGERFISQSFDAFCAEPRVAMERCYGAMGMPMPRFDFSRIHPPNGPYRPASPDWRRYRELLKLPRV
jgi:hypothetical protein